MKIYLASASPRRRELLEQIGVQFEIIPAKGEERITKQQPKEVVEELSFQKAEEIYQGLTKGEEEFLVIGADTVVACEDRILGKPKSEEHAKEMLTLLQGRGHQVYTGVTLLLWRNGAKEQYTFAEATNVFMYPMSEQQILDYIKTGEPMDKAGSYAIQGRCAVHIRKIEGDYNNVVGLPIARIYQTLSELRDER